MARLDLVSSRAALLPRAAGRLLAVATPRRRRLLLVYGVVCLVLFLTLREGGSMSDDGRGVSRGGLSGLLAFLFTGGGLLPGLQESLTSSAALSGTSAPGFDVINYIDPLIGTTNGGHVFPGASIPYGMAKAVADTDSSGENAAGFVSDNAEIIGFSHMHDSGTGGSASLGNFPLFVHPGCPDNNYTLCHYPVKKRLVARVNGTVEAKVGYFALNMTNSVRAEMTTTAHTALYRFSFPGTKFVNNDGELVPYSPLILMDMVDLSNSRLEGDVEVHAGTGRITARGMFNPSFGKGNYTAYVCVDFQGAEIRNTGTFLDETAMTEPKKQPDMSPGLSYPSGSGGAWVHFEPPPPSSNNQIMARVGLSFISKARACQTAQREIPTWDFEGVVNASRAAWREKLAVVEYDGTGVSDDMQTVFWSGIYRSMLSPQDYTGENPRWQSDEPYFDSFYCIWDSFRAQHPLLTILDPSAQAKMVRSLLDIFRNEGKLPDCRMSFCKGYTQGGSNADVVLADSYLKNITENISWPTAYAAVLSDAEEEPEDWSIEGRGNLESYHRLGYIPWNDEDKNGTGPASRTVSRTLEYAYDDYCISVLARGRGDRVDEEKYLFRSTGWRNLWNPHQKDMVRDGRGYYVKSRFTGFMQPRLLNGSFRFQSPRLCSPIHEPHLCYFDTAYDTYEGSPWLYTFYVPQDMAGLIEVLGGPGPFIERLHYFHESGIIYMGNEQSFLPTFQFHYGGRPGLSSYWAHRYVPSIFNHSINGIPGNDDCAMGAFTAFIYMGFFPVAGQDVYLLIPPLFPEVRIRARNGKQAIIRNINFDPTGKEKIYIQSATLNGKPYTRSWITHSFFMEGGLLELVLGSGESAAWGTAPEDLPPSTSSHPDERVRAIANGTVRYLPDLVYEGPPPSSDGDAPQSYPWPPPVPENSPDYDPAGQPPPQQVPMAQPPDSSAGGGGVSGGGGIGSSNGSTPAPIEQNLPPVKLPTRPHSSNVTPSSSKSDAESSGSGLGVGEQVPDPLPLSHENPGPRELAEIRAQAHRAGVESKNRAASQQRGGMGSQGPTFHRRPPVEENAAGKSHGGETALGDQGGQEKQQERQQTARLKDELKQP